MTEHCERCQGSGEDPEGFLAPGGPDAVTHDGPCRQCLGSGEPSKPLATRLVASTPTGRNDLWWNTREKAEAWHRAAEWLHVDYKPAKKFCIGCCGWVTPEADKSLPCGH